MPDNRTLIILGDTLSSNLPASQPLACVLGPAHITQLSQTIQLEGYSRILICASPDQEDQVLRLVLDHLDPFSTTPTGLINFTATPQDPGWITDVSAMIGCQTKQSAAFSPDADISQFIDFAMSFRMANRKPVTENPSQEQLRPYVENFLTQHNTCTLATAYKGLSHATPIEYRYANGYLFCVSEGGEKFAGLFSNGKVSIAIYDAFDGFNKLAGMQLNGRARIPIIGSGDYNQVLERWKLSPDKIYAMPFLLHAIIIRLQEATFLSAQFKHDGWDVRQTYKF